GWVGEDGWLGRGARREAPVLGDQLGQLGEAVATHVGVTEGEPAALVLRPAAQPLARLVHPRELEVALHGAPEAVDEGPVVGEIGRAEIAHVPLLRSGSRRAGGRVPSG